MAMPNSLVWKYHHRLAIKRLCLKTSEEKLMILASFKGLFWSFCVSRHFSSPYALFGNKLQPGSVLNNSEGAGIMEKNLQFEPEVVLANQKW